MTRLKIKLLAGLLLTGLTAFSQTLAFTWKNGSSGVVTTGYSGTQGVPSPSNTPSGRGQGSSWLGNNGILWYFGGEGAGLTNGFGANNDLWKYDPATNAWAWMNGDLSVAMNGVYGTQGVAAAANKPGARLRATTWTDASGNLWLFGGFGRDISMSNDRDMNDLWKYNPSSNQWTWMKGSSASQQAPTYGTIGIANAANVPGAREGALGWADASGNLWLFGGYGYPSNSSSTDMLNDLWKYNIATNQWTWMKGSNTGNPPGVYGTQGVAANNNVPGCREEATGGTDASGNFWLFGGFGYGTANASWDYLNDLWKYTPSSNQWTWMKGNTVNGVITGTYGTQGSPAATNSPGSRRQAVSWFDGSGNFWLFGGHGYASTNNLNEMNDLWKFSAASGQWTWVKGANTTVQTGIYGTQGSAAATNMPGSRNSGVCWYNPSTSTAWIMGGYGSCSVTSSTYLNDLWSLRNCTIQNISINNNSIVNVCAGIAATLTAIGANAYTWSNNNTGASIVVSPTTNTGYTVTSSDANSCNNTATVSVNVSPSPTVSIQNSTSVVCVDQSFDLTASGAANYTWSTGQNSAVVSLVASIGSNTYAVSGTDGNGCVGTATVAINVITTCTGIKENSLADHFVVYPNPNNGSFIIELDQTEEQADLIIVNTLGQIAEQQKLNQQINTIHKDLAAGLYYYQVIRQGETIGSGKLLIKKP